MSLKIKIDGEIMEVDNVLDYGHLPMIQIGNLEYYVAEDSQLKGEIHYGNHYL